MVAGRLVGLGDAANGEVFGFRSAVTKKTSAGCAARMAATWRRAYSTADLARCPNEWTDCALPYSSDRYGNIASITSFATGVVALLSRYTFIPPAS
jgi:hypothetical protein